jgi:hypothetical protein
MYDLQFLHFLKSYENRWVGSTVGAPGSSDSPRSLRSKIKIKYPQGEDYYCLANSFASALHYCGYTKVGFFAWEQKDKWSRMSLDQALVAVRTFMEFTIPAIGRPTQFMIRNASKKKRPLTLEEVIASPSRYPMVLIPSILDVVPNHALCVVDDLVFDSITHHALRLCKETFLWIFNDQPVTIHRAFRFDQDVSPKLNKSTYDQPLTLHIDPGTPPL